MERVEVQRCSGYSDVRPDTCRTPSPGEHVSLTDRPNKKTALFLAVVRDTMMLIVDEGVRGLLFFFLLFFP